jgi:hypothetical protein
MFALGSIPKHTKKMTILVFFILARTSTKSIQFINKTLFFFGVFHIVVLVLRENQQQQKIVNSNTISVCYAWALGNIFLFLISQNLK